MLENASLDVIKRLVLDEIFNKKIFFWQDEQVVEIIHPEEEVQIVETIQPDKEDRIAETIAAKEGNFWSSFFNEVRQGSN